MEIEIKNKYNSSDCTTYARAIIPEGTKFADFLKVAMFYDKYVTIKVASRTKKALIWLEFVNGKEAEERVPKWVNSSVIKNTKNITPELNEQIIPSEISINYGWGRTDFNIHL